MEETGRGQKPAVAPRRRMVISTPDIIENAEHRTKSASTSDILAAATTPNKSKPARPGPPKFKPEVPPPPTFTKKTVGPAKKAIRKPSPPSEPAPRELLQSALSQYYGTANGHGHATAPSKGRRKSMQRRNSNGEGNSSRPTTYLNVAPRTPSASDGDGISSSLPTVYLNVAPRTPSAMSSSRSQNSVTGLRTIRTSPPSKRVVGGKIARRPSPLQMRRGSDSREGGSSPTKSPTPLTKVSPIPKHLSLPERQRICASNSVPLSGTVPTSTTPKVRQGFTRQLPPPKSSSGQGRVPPVRPAPPRPYNKRNVSHSTNVDKGVDGRTKASRESVDAGIYELDRPDSEITEYTYVDPQICRYQTNLEALDLSTHGHLNDRSIYMNSKSATSII